MVEGFFFFVRSIFSFFFLFRVLQWLGWWWVGGDIIVLCFIYRGLGSRYRVYFFV